MAIFLLASALIASHRPDALLQAQFWAEDGTIFYANAYHFGFHALLIPYTGYLNVVSQLVGLLALLIPMREAPLVMNLCAIAVQALPVSVFLSSRFSRVPFSLRCAAAVCYVALPNAYEIQATISNVQWTLGLLALLVILAEPARSTVWRIFDLVVLVLISLDGPLGIMLIPFGAIVWWKRRERWSASRVFALLPGACIQAAVLLSQSRLAGTNGATARRLVTILARQVFFPSLIGLATVSQHLEQFTWRWELGMVLVGLGLIAFAIARGPFELKVALVFGAVVLAAGLTRPLVAIAAPSWEVMTMPGAANRYYFLAEIAFLSTLIWIVWNGGSPRLFRGVAILLLLALPFGILADWRHPPFADLHFPQQARQFQLAPAGTRMVIPINPPGRWMELRKH